MMMNKKFTILSLLAIGSFFSACDKDAFNEQDAIDAQKELLAMRYNSAKELETMRLAAEKELAQLNNTAANALEVLRINAQIKEIRLQDSLARAAQQPAPRPYTIMVEDHTTGMPVSGATVSTVSEGKAVTGTTNAQGSVTFNALRLYPQSRLTITKTGYAATSITRDDLDNMGGEIELYNTAMPANNKISGTLYIESNLTNSTVETVPAGTMVMASVNVTSGTDDFDVTYTAVTDANGKYEISVPQAANCYTVTVPMVTTNQTLYVNGIVAPGSPTFGAATQFPNIRPSIATISTTFMPGDNSTFFPSNINNPVYFTIEADSVNNAVGYVPFNFSLFDTQTRPNGTTYELSNVYSGNFINNIWTTSNVTRNLRYKKNDTLTVSLVDWSGKYVQGTNSPKLIAVTNQFGQIVKVDFERNKSNAATNPNQPVTGARGIFNLGEGMAPNYVPTEEWSYFNYATTNLVGVSNNQSRPACLQAASATTLIRNFHYGYGASRNAATVGLVR